jgi:allantoinase
MKLIRNVSMASGSTFKTVNVLFDETILQIGTGPITADSITEEYDFSGCLIMPGAVDMHTHLMNGTDKDGPELHKTTQAAILGGYTTLADLSYTTDKPIFRGKDLKHYQSAIEANSFCDMAVWGHCDFSEFPYHLNHMNDAWSAGIVGFSIMHPSPNTRIEDISYEDIMDLFDTIYDTDISFAFQGFDASEPSTNLDTRNALIEQRLTAIRKILRRLQDNPLHFIGIHDKASVEILNTAFRRSDLTYAVPLVELMKIITQFNQTGYKKDEPFSEYVKLLFDSMKNGKFYTISTESGSELRSDLPLANEAYSGYPVNLLQWAVPWVFSQLWKANKLSIQSCIRLLSENPAKRLGLFPQKGCIQKGSHADITILDPNTPVISGLKDDKGNKITLSCSVQATFLRGNLLTPLKAKQNPQGKFVIRTGTTRRKSNSSCWN